MTIKSETVTNEETFSYSLELNEDNEIIAANEYTMRCSECGEIAIPAENEDEVDYCEEHPSAVINTAIDAVSLVDTPTGIGEDSDTDVVFFTDGGPKGSFGLQVRDAAGGLKAICDLDGEVYSFSGFQWIIPDKAPAPIAAYAEAVCS